MPPKRVITVHGINTTGKWQEQLQRALSPHFEFKNIKYDDYQSLGGLKLVFAPTLLLIFAPIVIGSFYWSYFAGIPTLVIALLVCHLASYKRRKRAFASYKQQLDQSLLYGGRPHIISHSFGTYLTGMLLKKFPDVRFSHIVLTGCVLSKDFPWQRIRQANPQAYRKIRNEIAVKDIVARLALLLRGVLPGLGHAGVVGIKGSKDFVHDVESPNQICPSCSDYHDRTPIHNVRCAELGHSDHFLGNNHAISYWVPFFWNMDPGEYRIFLDLCLALAELEEDGDDSELAVAEEELRETEWRWAKGLTLEMYVQSQLFTRLTAKHSPEIVISTVVRLTWQIISRAKEAQAQGSADLGEFRKLYPCMAVACAIGHALAES